MAHRRLHRLERLRRGLGKGAEPPSKNPEPLDQEVASFAVERIQSSARSLPGRLRKSSMLVIE